MGIRYDWTLYPQPSLNPAIPLTGQYPNNYDRGRRASDLLIIRPPVQ